MISSSPRRIIITRFFIIRNNLSLTRTLSFSTNKNNNNNTTSSSFLLQQQIPQLVEQVLSFQHDSIRVRWQQELSHLQRRRRQQQQQQQQQQQTNKVDGKEWEMWSRPRQESQEYNVPVFWDNETIMTCSHSDCTDYYYYHDDSNQQTQEPQDLYSYISSSILQSREKQEPNNNNNSNALFTALALLRTMTASDWKRFEQEIMSQDDNDDNDDSIDDTIERIDNLTTTSREDDDDMILLFQQQQQQQHPVDTNDANLWLARLAVALDLDHDDAMSLMIHHFQSMSQPDAISYEILISAILHRFEQDATPWVNAILSQWTPECLTVAMQAWKKKSQSHRGLLWNDKAWELLQTVYEDTTRDFKIQNKTFHIAMEMAISEQRGEEVLRLMDMAMKETKRRTDTNVETILLAGLNFSLKERHATDFLTKVMDILEGRTILIPSARVWRHFIFVASARRRKDNAVAVLLRRAFDHLCTPSFRPNDRFLSIGLDVSETLGDTELAVDLVLRRFGRQSGRRVQEALPILQILRAVNICVDHGDIHKGRLILDRCSADATIHVTLLQKMYTAVLQGYAEKGDPAAAKQLLSQMAESSIPISQGNLASTIRAYALCKDLPAAQSFLTAIEDGIFDVTPDASIYGSTILACVRVSAWQDALEMYERLHARGLKPMASTVYCLLLAAHRLGGSLRTEQLVHDIVESGGSVDMACCVLACSLLLRLPGPIQSMKDVQREIRRITDNDDAVRNISLQVLKTLRVAELEQDRLGNGSDDSWRTALSSILDLVRAMRTDHCYDDDETKQYS